MGLKITSDDKGVMVFRDDKGQYPSYYYSISRKNDKDEWESCYRPIRFKKGIEVQNKTVIAINSAFESFNIGKDGKKYPYLMVTDYSVMEAPEPEISIPESAGDADVVPFK
jgi:hypothetical protein